MGHHSEAFIGIDASKLSNAVAIAEGDRNGEVRYLGEIPNAEAATHLFHQLFIAGQSGCAVNTSEVVERQH